MENTDLKDDSNEDIKKNLLFFNSGVAEGIKHSTTSPETLQHLNNMNMRIDEGFLRIEKKVEEGFSNNSKEHEEIKEQRIRPLELWKAKVEGVMLGAGKSVSIVWIIVALVGGWIFSPLISSYITRNSYQKIEQSISSQEKTKTNNSLVLKEGASQQQ